MGATLSSRERRAVSRLGDAIVGRRSAEGAHTTRLDTGEVRGFRQVLAFLGLQGGICRPRQQSSTMNRHPPPLLAEMQPTRSSCTDGGPLQSAQLMKWTLSKTRYCMHVAGRIAHVSPTFDQVPPDATHSIESSTTGVLGEPHGRTDRGKVV